MLIKSWTNVGLLMLAVSLAAAGDAFAQTSCGTIAAPIACSVTVGNVTYTATNFTFVAASGIGGGNTYQAGDIDIAITTGGGGTGLLQFGKHPSSPTAGLVFFANPGETVSFSFSYDLTITPSAPGTVIYAGSVVSSFDETHTANATAAFQTILFGAPSCLAFTGSTTAICSLPPGTTTFLTVGDILTLTGNTGNTGVTLFQSSFDASFTAAPPDLSLSKSDGGASVSAGGTVAYTLTYANAGGDATGVVITETVPDNTTFDGAASTAGWACTPDGSAGSTCTLAVGAVAGASGPANATFAVDVADPIPPGVIQIANTASIADDGAAGVDPVPADNVGADATPISGPAAAVPALSRPALLLLGWLLATAAWVFLRSSS